MDEGDNKDGELFSERRLPQITHLNRLGEVVGGFNFTDRGEATKALLEDEGEIIPEDVKDNPYFYLTVGEIYPRLFDNIFRSHQEVARARGTKQGFTSEEIAIIRKTAVKSALDQALVVSQVAELGARDGLTGLWNRAAIEKYLELLFDYKAKTGQLRGVTVLFVDVDDFKAVNDKRGHTEGDKILREVAQSLKENIRPLDMAGGRFGGDEFCLIWPATKLSENSAVYQGAEKLRRKISLAIEKKFGITLSLGAIILEENLPPEELYKKLSALLHQTKDAGKDCGFSPEGKIELPKDEN